MLRRLSAVGVVEQQRRLCPQPGLPAPAALQQHQTGDPGGVVLPIRSRLGSSPKRRAVSISSASRSVGNTTQKRPPHRSSQPAARHTSSSVHTTSDRATLRVSCGETRPVSGGK